jgi:hypothetical protein
VDGDPEGDETALVLNPSAGLWKIVVDGSSVPSGSTEVEVLDAVFNPVYGMVSTTDLPQERASGARWMAKAHTWFAPAVHGEGRRPWAALLVEGVSGGGGTHVVALEPLEALGLPEGDGSK